MRVSLEKVTPAHIDTVAAGMRQCDRDEIWASHRSLPEPALREGARISTWCRAGTVDGVAVAILGVAPGTAITGEGRPWLLGSDSLKRVPRPFVRLAPAVVNVMQDFYPRLVNFVDARNAHTVRWLKSLGFTVDEPMPHGVDGLPFHRFWRNR